MSTKRYKVWVEVEELDAETEESTSLGLEMNWASCAEFDNKAKALDFGLTLHQIATGEIFHRND